MRAAATPVLEMDRNRIARVRVEKLAEARIGGHALACNAARGAFFYSFRAARRPPLTRGCGITEIWIQPCPTTKH